MTLGQPSRHSDPYLNRATSRRKEGMQLPRTEFVKVWHKGHAALQPLIF